MKLYQSNEETLEQYEQLKTQYVKEGICLDDFIYGRKPTEIEDGISRIHVCGMLLKNATAIDKALGCTDYDELIEDLEDAEKNAKAVIITFDSGGGMVTGCYEVAKTVENLKIPVVGYIKSMACSAAYKIASSCSWIVSEYSATSGNIGSILVTIDRSKLESAMGYKTICFVNDGASLKSIGHNPSLTGDQAAFLQESINDAGMAFIKHVKENRPDISEDCFKAGWYSMDKAKDFGLIDEFGNGELAEMRARELAQLATEIELPVYS